MANYDEFQSSYKKMGFAQPTINVTDKRQFRNLLDTVINDIIIFNDLLNVYDYSEREKKQILNWLKKIGYKKETFMQMLVELNMENYYEDGTITETDYTDLHLFESDINIEAEIDEMEYITEDDFSIVNEIEDMTFLMEAKKPTLKQNIDSIEEYFEEYGIPITNKFDLKKFSKNEGLDQNTLAILLCNMDSDKVMTDIANGDYDSFNIEDSSQFNDSYEDMLNDLGFGNDDEDYQDDEY